MATDGGALRAWGVAKRYDDTVALSGVDLTVAAGELRGLVGPNGAGKTTLLRALLGLTAIDSGRIEVLGRPATAGLPGVAGFVEEPAFYPYLSGRANLQLLAELDDVPGADIDAALTRVDLLGRAGDRVGGYSTGMRQRLGIAAALLRDPRVLLLDEPTSGLDPRGIRAVGGLLRELAGRGVAIVVSSHQIGELESICDAYTIVRDGAVVWDGSAARLREEARGSRYALGTSDDARALALAADQPGIEAARDDDGIRLVAELAALDRFTAGLGAAGVSIRHLELRVSPLEHMFFSLTGEPEDAA